MNEEQLRDSLKRAVEENEGERISRDDMDLSFLDIPLKRRPIYKTHVFKAIAAIICIVLIAGLSNYWINGQSAYAFRTLVDKMQQNAAGNVVTTDPGDKKSGRVETLTVTKKEGITCAKKFAKGVYVPQYIPDGYRFKKLNIEKEADGSINGTYYYTGKGEKYIQIWFVRDTKDATLGINTNSKPIKLKDRVIYAVYDNVENDYSVCMVINDELLQIDGDVSKTTMINIAKQIT
ncbi:MAG: DUF4367 domain-containing protein [Eubacteriaceae bacterium]|nr:DUF4367 domain-containing protein [Eubacteriaceae bacterium]